MPANTVDATTHAVNISGKTVHETNIVAFADAQAEREKIEAVAAEAAEIYGNNAVPDSAFWSLHAKSTGINSIRLQSQAKKCKILNDAIIYFQVNDPNRVPIIPAAEARAAFVILRDRQGGNAAAVVHRPSASILAANSVLTYPEGAALARWINKFSGTAVIQNLIESNQVPIADHVVHDPRAPTGALVGYSGQGLSGMPLDITDIGITDQVAVNLHSYGTTLGAYREIVEKNVARLRNQMPMHGPDLLPIAPLIEWGNYVWGIERFEVILHYLAFTLVGQPARIPVTLVLIGPQGIGKNTVIGAVQEELKAPTVTSAAFTGDFNEFMTKRLVVVDEVDTSTRYQFYTQLKAVVQSEGFITVNPKYGKQFQHFAQTQVIITSNHTNVLAIASDDRRIIPLISQLTDAQARDPAFVAYVQRFRRWADAPINKRRILTYLATIYNPDEDPLMLINAARQSDAVSADKEAIYEDAQAPETAGLREAFENDTPMQKRRVYTAADLHAWIELQLPRLGVDAKRARSPFTTGEYIRNLGLVKAGRSRIDGSAHPKVFFMRVGEPPMKPDQIRALYLEERAAMKGSFT